ncbi:hypothetical protein [Companilactobacillus hulinensis]|uniref:hypothetical protein n=1 Tax=Companilactobacillus hulinensis TaxID=2486007 RepID=UPI000F77D8EF|nr:hypothetical protein [Companilactobacillus hulinensis]
MENELEDIICMNLNNKQTIDLATAFIDAVQTVSANDTETARELLFSQGYISRLYETLATVSASINTVNSRLGDLIEKLPNEDK